jgi:hypothetical protein
VEVQMDAPDEFRVVRRCCGLHSLSVQSRVNLLVNQHCQFGGIGFARPAGYHRDQKEREKNSDQAWHSVSWGGEEP